MTRWLMAAWLAACALGGAGAAAQEPPVFRGRSDAVRIFVTVLDRDGRLVTSLAQGDFEVRDEGKPQPILLFDNSPQPIRLVVMLDVSGSMEGNLPLLREAAEALFTRLRRDDLARVGSFGADIRIGDTFTRDPRSLRQALPDGIPQDAPTPLWRALDEAMDSFDRDAEERRVVLVLSDGKDTDMGFGKPVASQAGVIDRARKDDVMIYAIGLRSRRRQSMMPGIGAEGLRAAMLDDLPDPGLARVAEETGGGYTEIRPGEDLAEAFARVADELHAQYLLGFAPPKRDGKVHDVEVRMSARGLKPRARRTYVAPRE
jgi:VWFA-related protein